MQITHEQHDDFEQVVCFSDDDFLAYVVIHNTKLGPALGGCRLKPYLTPADARHDAMRLARGMTYKSSLAGLNLGGGKCTVIADRPTREIMLKVAEAVNHFGGDYIIAEDVGTSLADIAICGEITPHYNRIDGSQMTARGVWIAMFAATLYWHEWGDDLDGVPIWVQGLGKVGMPLAMRLAQLEHANLMVSDLQNDRVQQACAAGAHKISERDKKFVGIYAPCAMGSVIDASNVNSIPYSIICGAANNQLADDSCAEILYHKHILYCPDFLVNAGGVITGACEIDQPYDEKRAQTMTDGIGMRLLEVFEMADKAKVSPLAMAKTMAEARL